MFQMVASGGALRWMTIFGVLLVAAMVQFGAFLPFLVLSSASPFYRERLKSLLHVRPEATTVFAPLVEASVKN
jgi:hypothetical protein